MIMSGDTYMRVPVKVGDVLFMPVDVCLKMKMVYGVNTTSSESQSRLFAGA